MLKVLPVEPQPALGCFLSMESTRESLLSRPGINFEHHVKCPTCGSRYDFRDVGQVLDHNGPDAPHPKADEPYSARSNPSSGATRA